MLSYALPIGFALFVWWFSTGLIIYLDGLPRQTFRWSMLGASVLLIAALYVLAVSSRSATLSGAYWAFTAGVIAWGWQEISFYMGFVTGPRRAPCAEGCRGWRHFVHAVETSLYHELAIIAAAAAVITLTWGEPNQVGTWTFMILWWMHQSAKLNVFLGVRNLNEEFLPEHLNFLKSFLTKRPMNLLFPFSITISTVIATLLIAAVVAPATTPFDHLAYLFLGTMMTLAILEHWFLVLPLPAAKLWSWGLASRAAIHPFTVEIVAGFLGAGKTTLMRRRLESAAGPRTVVLVNDFAAVGIDGSLLAGAGADVVELPNGCICCSLSNDLARQLTEMVARFAPERVLIEPSGVADVAALVGVLSRPELTPLVSSLRLEGVIDAGAFLRDYARMPAHFVATTRLAARLIINKCDLVSPAELRVIAATLRRLNPSVAIVPAMFGIEQAGEPERELTALMPNTAEAAHEHHDLVEGHGAEDHADHHHADHHHAEHPHGEHSHGEAALGLSAWSRPLGFACDAGALEGVLIKVAEGGFGRVERVKGIARAGDGWVHFDVAGGRPSMAAFAPAENEAARVVAIGREVDEPGLQAAFDACAVPAGV